MPELDGELDAHGKAALEVLVGVFLHQEPIRVLHCQQQGLGILAQAAAEPCVERVPLLLPPFDVPVTFRDDV